jgi:hypothetical protein
MYIKREKARARERESESESESERGGARPLTSEAFDAKGVTTNATKKAGIPVALPKLPTAST